VGHPAREGVELVVPPVELRHLLLDGVLLAAEHARHRGAHAEGERHCRERDQRADEGGLGPQALPAVQERPGLLGILVRQLSGEPVQLVGDGPQLRLEVLPRPLRLAPAAEAQRHPGRLRERAGGLVEALPELLLSLGEPLRVRQPSFLGIGERLLHPRIGELASVITGCPDVVVDQVLQHRDVDADPRDERLTLERRPEQLVDARVGAQLVPEREGGDRGQQADHEEERRAIAAEKHRSIHDGGGILVAAGLGNGRGCKPTVTRLLGKNSPTRARVLRSVSPHDCTTVGEPATILLWHGRCFGAPRCS